MDKRTVLDRLASALVSDDMSQSTLRLTDADMNGALGYAGRHIPMASALVRLYLSHSPGAAAEARKAAVAIVRKEAARMGLSLRVRELKDVAVSALEYCADPRCGRCHGTKYELIPGSTVLGDIACKACKGDGRRELPLHQRKLVVRAIARIERIESNIDAMIRDRL